jgi:glycosyltransferase involved in cell wall biosynthesis
VTPELVLVVPCYNEAGRLDVEAFLACAAARPSLRLLFVDDGSADATGEVLARMAAAAPANVAVVTLPANAGKAEAVRQGVLAGLAAGPAYVGYWDADLSTPLAALDDFLTVLQARPQVDVVLGSRVLLLGRDIRRLAWRHYLGRVFATAVSLTLDLPVYDTQCGAKVIRAGAAAAGLFAEPFRSRWIFDVELLARYLAVPVRDGGPPRRARLYELALRSWRHRSGSKLRPGGYVRAAVDLARIWWTHFPVPRDPANG